MLNRHRRPDSQPQTIHRRPVWIILFAAILILTAGVSSAQSLGQLPPQDQTDPTDLTDPTDPTDQTEPTTIVQYNEKFYRLPAAVPTRADNAQATQPQRAPRGGRPKYATVHAVLSNFDSDALPDGWIAEVKLLDAKDRAVIRRCHATFELMPRLPSADYVGYVNAQSSPVRWSKPLKFDADGVARVKLPLANKLDAVFDRHATILPDPGLGSTLATSRHVVLRRSLSGSSTAYSRDWRYNVGRPESGQLKVKVSVPTEGVFQAVTAVPMRPSVLVDTNWPYR